MTDPITWVDDSVSGRQRALIAGYRVLVTVGEMLVEIEIRSAINATARPVATVVLTGRGVQSWKRIAEAMVRALGEP